MMDNDDTLLNNGGPQSGAETVYGTEDNNMVMSEKVIASQRSTSACIYKISTLIPREYYVLWIFE